MEEIDVKDIDLSIIKSEDPPASDNGVPSDRDDAALSATTSGEEKEKPQAAKNIWQMRFTCTFCDRRCVNKSQLRTHAKKYHPNLIKKCDSLTKPCFILLNKFHSDISHKRSSASEWVHFNNDYMQKLDFKLKYCITSKHLIVRSDDNRHNSSASSGNSSFSNNGPTHSQHDATEVKIEIDIKNEEPTHMETEDDMMEISEDILIPDANKLFLKSEDCEMREPEPYAEAASSSAPRIEIVPPIPSTGILPSSNTGQVEYSMSQRGGRVFIYSGFEYLYHRTLRDVETWRCRQHRTSKCRANLKIRDNIIVTQPTNHSHDSCPQKTEANIAKVIMKQSMKEEGANPRNIIRDVLMEVSEAALLYMPKESSLSRNLTLHKNRNQMPNPTTLNFIIPEIYNDLIIYDSGIDDSNRILALGNKDLLNELSKDVIFGDGTFDQVPNTSYQLFTWHVQIGISYPPCVYFLLNKKNSITYRKMFEAMKELVPGLKPREILIDFEEACITAARAVFPFSEIKGCYFHITQNLIKIINRAGLKSLYESDVEIKLMLKSLAALVFIPANDVKPIFDLLATTFPNENAYSEILIYFSFNYIEGPTGKEPQFPIASWNNHGTPFEQSPKMINCCEDYHNVLNSLFQLKNPNILNLFAGLKRDLSSHILTLANVKLGLEKKKNKYEKMYNAICTAVGEYGQTEDKIKYLFNLANLL